MFITSIGELIDVKSATNSVDSHTMERYKILTYNKTAFYTVYSPVALALYFTG